MRIGLYVPAYRGSVRLEHMRSHTDNREWALSQGHEVGEFDTQSCHIDEARNLIVKMAIGYDCDRLLMMDADVAVERPANGLAALMSIMDETKAAAVGSVVLRRTGEVNSFDDSQSVGTGLMLVDLHQIGRIGGAWFQRRVSADGSETTCTGDIAFCRLLRARGMRVVVDDSIPTLHVGEQYHKFSPPRAAISGTATAPRSCAVEHAHG
jgi:hypothetical protein